MVSMQPLTNRYLMRVECIQRALFTPGLRRLNARPVVRTALCVELLTLRPCGEKDRKGPQPFRRPPEKEALQTGAVQTLRFLQSTRDLPITLCVLLYADPFRQIPGRLAGLALALRACPPPSSICRCRIGEMPRKVPAKCAIAGCHRRLKMTLGEREELRRVGWENNATAGLVCPAHVRAAFNFEFDEIDIDVPLGELLVEASKENPRWRVMLTPLPGAAGELDCQSMPGRGNRVI